jgi:putative oxidoreductase
MTIVLWIVQVLLALAFIMAGFMKAFQPIEKVRERMNWARHVAPGLIRFIGTVEILGALGLILPVATHILPWLTPIAALGLVLTMLVATALHLRLKEASRAAIPLVLLLLSLFVAIGYLVIVPAA